MGCDIHIVCEVRQDGRWKTHSVIESDRNYSSFAIMAGVRNGRAYGEDFKFIPPEQRPDWLAPISEPRGFPLDVAVVYKDGMTVCGERLYGWEHSESWLTLAEMKAYPLPKKIRPFGPWLFVKIIEEMEAIIEKGAPNNIRIVFAFDS